MKAPIGSGATAGLAACRGADTDGANARADVTVRLVEPGSAPDVAWLALGVVVETPTSRRANANAAHITGVPTGSPACPADDCDPGPNPNHDNNPATTLVTRGAAGAGGETATVGSDTFAVVDTDGAAGDDTASVEAPEEAAVGVGVCAVAGVGLPADRPSLPRTPASATTAGREAPPTLDATPSWCFPRVPDFAGEDPELALPDDDGCEPPVEPDAEVLAPPDADTLDSGELPDGVEPPDAVEPPDVGAVPDDPEVSDVDAGAGCSCCSSVWPEPASAKATIGPQAIAEPTPSATASAPIRPMFAA